MTASAKIALRLARSLVNSLDGGIIDRIGKTQGSKRDRESDDEPHRPCWSTRPRIDLVEEFGKWQSAIPGKGKGLTTGWEDNGSGHAEFCD